MQHETSTKLRTLAAGFTAGWCVRPAGDAIHRRLGT